MKITVPLLRQKFYITAPPLTTKSFVVTAARSNFSLQQCRPVRGRWDAKGLDGCLGPKHPPAGGCLAESTAKADFYAAASAASAAASAVCIYDVVIGGRFAPGSK